MLQDKNSKHRSDGGIKAAVDGRAVEPTWEGRLWLRSD